MAMSKEPRPSSWSTGLFDCFTDMPSCFVGCLLPSVLYGENVSAVKGEERSGSSCCAFFVLQTLSQFAVSVHLLYALSTCSIASIASTAFWPIYWLCTQALLMDHCLDNRKKIKEAYNIQKETCCGFSLSKVTFGPTINNRKCFLDWSYLIHMFCLSCALCQEARELKIRGHSHENPLCNKRTDYKPPTIITEAPVQVQSIGGPSAKQSLAQKEEKEEVEDLSETTALLNPILTDKV